MRFFQLLGVCLSLLFFFLLFSHFLLNHGFLSSPVFAMDIGGNVGENFDPGPGDSLDSYSPEDATAGVDSGAGADVEMGGFGSDPGPDGGGDDGYVPPDSGGASVLELTSVIPAGCSGIYPLVRYDFIASWSSDTIRYEVWRKRQNLDNWTVIRELTAPGSYLDDRLEPDSYNAPFVEYAITRIDTRLGNIESNHLTINVQNCNPTTAPPAPPPPAPTAPPGSGGIPPPANAAVTVASAANGACSGVYPRVDVNFSSNFNPAGGYELWHFNNPYRGWEKFGNASTPGTYTDTMADSNWYQGVTTYMVRAIDSGGGRLIDSNNVAMVTANCNGGGGGGGGTVTLNSALNTSCNGIYPVVTVNFSSNFAPAGGYQLLHHNNPYRTTWEEFGSRPNAPGTYIDDRADSNWYQGVTTYVVRALDAGGNRIVDSNNIAIVTTDCNPPSSVRFSGNPVPSCSGTESRMTLRWTVPNHFNLARGDRYQIYRVDGADNMAYLGQTDQNSFVDSVANSTLYSYNIRAVTQSGVSDSGWSNGITSYNCNEPVVNLYVNNSRAPLPVAPGTNVEIRWDSQNADVCTASSVPSQSYWNGSKALLGTQLSGVLAATPNLITYALKCDNTVTGGTRTMYVPLNISGQRPCLKTTGGDVHSNESISGPPGCN